MNGAVHRKKFISVGSKIFIYYILIKQIYTPHKVIYIGNSFLTKPPGQFRSSIVSSIK